MIIENFVGLLDGQPLCPLRELVASGLTLTAATPGIHVFVYVLSVFHVFFFKNIY